MFEKAVQALAVMTAVYLVFLGGMLSFFSLIYLLFTEYYWLTLAYLVWLKIDGKAEQQVTC